MQADSPSKPTAAPAVPAHASGPGSAQPNGGLPKDLMQRIVSGVILAAVAAALLYAGVRPFTGFVFVVAVAMCWEWGHIVRKSSIDTVFIMHAAAVGVGVIMAGWGFAAIGLLTVLIGALIVLALRFGETDNQSFFQQGVDNVSVLTTVPEPATWALLIGGFGAVGVASRRSRRAVAA